MRPAVAKPMSRTNAPVRKVTLLAAGLPKSVRTCARRCHSAQGCPLRLGRGGFVVVFFGTAHVPDTQWVTFTVTTTGTEFFE